MYLPEYDTPKEVPSRKYPSTQQMTERHYFALAKYATPVLRYFFLQIHSTRRILANFLL